MLEFYKDLNLVAPESTLKNLCANPQYILKPPYDQVYMRGQWIPDAFEEHGLAHLPISEGAKDDLQELIEKLDELYEWQDAEGNAAFDCPVDAASPHPRMRRLDEMTMGEYVTSQGWSLEMIKMFDPLLRSAYGLGHDRISAWAALDILMDELLEADPGESALGFPGGNAFLTERTAGRLDKRQLRTATLVTQIEEKNREVLVSVWTAGKTVQSRERFCCSWRSFACYRQESRPRKFWQPTGASSGYTRRGVVIPLACILVSAFL